MRLLLRKTPGAEQGAPPLEIAKTIATAKRHFADEKTDFSDVMLDLSDQGAFFRQVYDAARRVGWRRITT